MQERESEEEEWAKLNERLKIREQERIERERKQAEDDAKRIEDLKNVSVRFFSPFITTIHRTQL